jgi:Flp pilus assembly pilin Flp
VFDRFHILLTPGRQNARMLAATYFGGSIHQEERAFQTSQDFGEGCFMATVLSRFFAEAEGTTSIEYALVAVGIAVAVVAAVNTLGNTVLVTQFDALAAAFNL